MRYSRGVDNKLQRVTYGILCAFCCTKGLKMCQFVWALECPMARFSWRCIFVSFANTVKQTTRLQQALWNDFVRAKGSRRQYCVSNFVTRCEFLGSDVFERSTMRLSICVWCNRNKLRNVTRIGFRWRIRPSYTWMMVITNTEKKESLSKLILFQKAYRRWTREISTMRAYRDKKSKGIKYVGPSEALMGASQTWKAGDSGFGTTGTSWESTRALIGDFWITHANNMLFVMYMNMNKVGKAQ